MHLSPQEKDKLLIVTAALLAERRLNGGLKLNHPEAVAWLSFLVLEGARDGKSVAELMQEDLRQELVQVFLQFGFTAVSFGFGRVGERQAQTASLQPIGTDV